MRNLFLAAMLTVTAACGHTPTIPTTPDPGTEIPIPIPTPTDPTPPLPSLPTGGSYKQVGKLPKGLDEGSGMAFSRSSGRLYTHNDSGGDPELYVSDKTGKQLGLITVKGAAFDDWEAAAWGPCPKTSAWPNVACIYIGDLGNNEVDRKSAQIYYFPEPLAATATVTAAKLEFSFCGPKDAQGKCSKIITDSEGLAVGPDGSIYVSSKLYENYSKQALFKIEGNIAYYVMNIPGVKQEIGALTLSPNGKVFAVSESNTTHAIVLFNLSGEFIRLIAMDLGQEEMLEFSDDSHLFQSTENDGGNAPLVEISLTYSTTPTTPAPGEEVPPGPKARYIPRPGISYQILSENDGDYLKQILLATELVVIECVTDDYGALKELIDAIHAKGKRVSCYHSLSRETWRPDIHRFPNAAKGKTMAGYPDENWADWRPSSPAHSFWDARYDEFAKAGADCVEDDNEIDPEDNDSGFPLSRADADGASKRRADYAHKLGMCHLAKNNPTISDIKSKHSDGVMIEEAGRYSEREDYIPWRQAGKFGAMIEYSSSYCKPFAGFSVQYHSGDDYFNGVKFKNCN